MKIKVLLNERENRIIKRAEQILLTKYSSWGEVDVIKLFEIIEDLIYEIENREEDQE